MTEKFGREYFMDGPANGLSNYVDYRWLPDQTKLCVERIMHILGARIGDSVLDWGCSRGYYVKALRMLGYEAFGYDISKWAIQNCDPDVSEFVGNGTSGNRKVQWILAKDVLEHVPRGQLPDVIRRFAQNAERGVLLIVPLVDKPGGQYVTPADRADTTHVIAWTMDEWLEFIQAVIDQSGESMTVSGGYKLPGVKQAAEPYPKSTAFITMRRFEP